MKNILKFIIICFLLFSCSKKEDQEAEKSLTELGEKPEEIAKKSCVGCHLYPEPELLTKQKWKELMPEMAIYMGLYPSDKTRDSLISGSEFVKKRFIERNVYPEKPMISKEDFEAVTKYYIENAPEEIFTDKESPKIENDLSLFNLKIPEQKVKIPSSTMVYIKDDKIYLGDANTASLSVFDSDLNLEKTGNVNQGAVWMNFFENVNFLTVMGSFSPTDEPSGLLLAMPTDPNQQSIVLIDSLQRPVHTEATDMTGDGLPDFVICEFGNKTGQLSLYENLGNNNFEQKILRAKPGAIRSIVRDFDKDGDKDIMALFAQADEGIWLFENDGKGNFSQKTIIRFPSIYGSAFIDYADFNGDGLDDIIYCNGDNADLSIILKPYHGIRVFINQGNNNWEEEFFYQLNGTYKAIPYDYDFDGDIDIAAISFFPDFYNNPNEGFVFLENNENMDFSAHTFEDPSIGRWLTMDIGDPDLDGDADLVLGSLTMQVEPKGGGFVEKWMQSGIPFVMLENQIK